MSLKRKQYIQKGGQSLDGDAVLGMIEEVTLAILIVRVPGENVDNVIGGPLRCVGESNHSSRVEMGVWDHSWPGRGAGFCRISVKHFVRRLPRQACE